MVTGHPDGDVTTQEDAAPQPQSGIWTGARRAPLVTPLFRSSPPTIRNSARARDELSLVADAARIEAGHGTFGSGATDMTGEDCRYTTLDLSMAGAGNAQFKGIVVTDADVEVAGATNVALTMDGGELTGGLAGAGRIEYSGTVSQEAVDVAGFGWVGPAS